MSASVFPARAGMSPTKGPPLKRYEGVPRASGDEPPRDPLNDGGHACSPRERG